jgi:hypothetical protein
LKEKNLECPFVFIIQYLSIFVELKNCTQWRF